MKPRELKALIKLLRASGVVSYECNGMKLLLDPNHVSAPTAKRLRAANKVQDNEDLQDQLNKFVPQLTDEEWLISTNMIDPEEVN